MRKQYINAAKEIYIKEYIGKKDRVPNSYEINQFLVQFKKDNSEIDSYGLANSFLERYSFLGESSALLANKNISFLKKDLMIEDIWIKQLIDQIDIAKFTFNSFLRRISDQLDKLEKKLNNLLINFSNSDLFLFSIEEDFKNHDSIDLENSTAEVHKGYVTVKSKASYYDLTSCSIKSSVKTKNKLLSTGSSIGPKVLLTDNGEEWSYSVISQQPNGRVIVTLDLDLDLHDNEGMYLSSIILSGKTINKNSKTHYGIQISNNGSNYRSVIPRVKLFSLGENYTSIGEENITNIRIIFFKNAADEINESFNRYVFNLEKIKIRTEKIVRSKDILYAGPYTIRDESNNKINFSMAKLESDTCCIVPDKTSINFYLSKDNENWKEAYYAKDKQNILKFSDLDLAAQGERVDSTVTQYAIIESTENNDEYYLNFKIKTDLIKSISKNNIFIQRNLGQNNDSVIYNATNGWYYDEEKELYSCFFEIENIEGRYLNLGYSSAIIDGFIKSGLIKLEKGYHNIQINSNSYLELPDGLTTNETIENIDSLYPFNQKYLVEGYRYPVGFQGEQVYFGFDTIFSFLLTYVPEERFEVESDMDIYTIEEIEEYSYFKVKIDKHNSAWKSELNNVIIYGSNEDTSSIYLKAVIHSSNEGQTPHINSFNIRVI